MNKEEEKSEYTLTEDSWSLGQDVNLMLPKQEQE
jgi:hypothetical protein